MQVLMGPEGKAGIIGSSHGERILPMAGPGAQRPRAFSHSGVHGLESDRDSQVLQELTQVGQLLGVVVGRRENVALSLLVRKGLLLIASSVSASCVWARKAKVLQYVFTCWFR